MQVKGAELDVKSNTVHDTKLRSFMSSKSPLKPELDVKHREYTCYPLLSYSTVRNIFVFSNLVLHNQMKQ